MSGPARPSRPDAHNPTPYKAASHQCSAYVHAFPAFPIRPLHPHRQKTARLGPLHGPYTVDTDQDGCLFPLLGPGPIPVPTSRRSANPDPSFRPGPRACSAPARQRRIRISYPRVGPWRHAPPCETKTHAKPHPEIIHGTPYIIGEEKSAKAHR
jgi:hypothetical protein